MWQYKASGTHDRVIMHGLRPILDNVCRLLGFDTRDRSLVYLFSFSDEPFPGYQVCMQKVREGPDGGCYYRVAQSPFGDFRANGLFPAVVNESYLHGWPRSIYLKLEKSLTGGVVS